MGRAAGCPLPAGGVRPSSAAHPLQRPGCGCHPGAALVAQQHPAPGPGQRPARGRGHPGRPRWEWQGGFCPHAADGSPARSPLAPALHPRAPQGHPRTPGGHGLCGFGRWRGGAALQGVWPCCLPRAVSCPTSAQEGPPCCRPCPKPRSPAAALGQQQTVLALPRAAPACACVRVCKRACVRVCVCAYVHACARALWGSWLPQGREPPAPSAGAGMLNFGSAFSPAGRSGARPQSDFSLALLLCLPRCFL